MYTQTDPKKLFYFEPDYIEDEEEVYRKLAEHMDNVGIGLRGSEDGGHIQLMKNLVSLPQAVVIPYIPVDKWETADEIAKKMNRYDAIRDRIYVNRVLADIANHGLAFHKEEEGVHYYRMCGMIPGVLEFQLANQHEPQFVSKKFFLPYVGEKVHPSMFITAEPSWRWLPIGKDVVEGGEISRDYDDIEKIIDNAEKIALAPCMCRNLNPEPCKYGDDYECCMAFDDFATFYVEDMKVAYYADKQQVKDLVRKNMATGHVVNMAANSKKSEIICNCCDCCCTIIPIFRANNGPGKKNVSNYRLKINNEKCINCGLCCDEACFGRANKIVDGVFVHDDSSCVGCGICVRRCPQDALILVEKEKAVSDYTVPDDIFDLYVAQDNARKSAGI